MHTNPGGGDDSDRIYGSEVDTPVRKVLEAVAKMTGCATGVARIEAEFLDGSLVLMWKHQRYAGADLGPSRREQRGLGR